MRSHFVLKKSALDLILIFLFILSIIPATYSSGFAVVNSTNTPIMVAAAPLQMPLSLQYPGEFHDYDEMQEEIAYFHTQAPELIDLEVIGRSYEGRDITCLRITNETNPLQKAKTLVVAHHHGREQITVEAALRFILRLLNNFGIDPTLTEYVNTQEIYVIPSLNPDSLEYTVNLGNHWLRKNLRPFDHDGDGSLDEDGVEDVNMDGIISGFDVYTSGGIYLYTYYEGIDNDADGEVNEDPVGYVDLNRNYPSGFGNPGSSSDPYSQVYHGPAPFSEPETDSFRNFTQNHRFAMAFSLHSGINATYFPSYQSGLFVEPQLYQTLYSELDGLLPPWWNSDDEYALQGSPAHLATGYHGLWQDWMYEERQTLVPICFEIYRNASSVSASSVSIVYQNATHYIEEWTGIYGYFNPVASGIDTLFDEITPAFHYLLQLTPR
ncbi:MAG: M14 family zinc carboxypeptidase, partial [Candidatus Hermodarchaeota archaeon]|nr:M14 family zinc carboxypeptidase [Candidatus Hermodarchaeota archaeon]